MIKWFLPALVAGSVAACVQQPSEQLQMPEVVSSEEVAEVESVVLTARFDRVSTLKEAGFRVWSGTDGPVLSKASTPEGNSISARFEGLEPKTEYSYQVFFSNGQVECYSPVKTFRTLEKPAGPTVDPGEDPDNPDDPGHPDNPDEPAEKFDPTLLAYLLENYDTNGDGVMSQNELESITDLTISGLVLDSLDGLETLTELRRLGTGDNILACIDVSANKKLEFLAAGSDRYLEEIILDNPVLTQTYFIGAPALHHLDLSNCPQMGLCEWWDIALEEIDFSHNRDLTILRIGGTSLKELDLSSNKKLCILNSVGNPDLKVVWLWSGIKMESLEVDKHTEIRYK